MNSVPLHRGPTRLSSVLPLHVVVFTLANESFALPVVQVREILRLQEMTPLPKAPAFMAGVINLRGRVLAVIDLRKRFELEPASRSDEARIVIVRLPKALVGLIVDSVEEVLALPREAIQATPEVSSAHVGRQCLSGIAQVGTRLVLLLNTTAVFSEEEAEQLAQVRTPHEVE